MLNRTEMQFVYKTLNKIQTPLITWGNPFDCDGSDLIICVTGNPGVPDFYIEFGTELHKSTGFPVCVIGHAGHVQVPDVDSNILDNRESFYNLEGQVTHKLDLIINHINKNSKIHFIGHSIGSWVILELLQKHEDIISRTSTVQLLFPTLQRMAETKNGKFMNGILRRIHFLLMLLMSVGFLLPEAVINVFIKLYIKYNCLPQHYLDRIQKFINPAVLEKVLFLAYDEMDTVKELNLGIFDKVKHKTNVIYSNRDGWAPVSYMDDLKKFEPHLIMKQVDINHAFVLKSSERVAEMAANFIKLKDTADCN